VPIAGNGDLVLCHTRNLDAARTSPLQSHAIQLSSPAEEPSGVQMPKPPAHDPKAPVLAHAGVQTIDERARIARLARFVLAHRRLVMVAWLVVFLAGAAGASHVSKRLAVDFSLPGQPGYVTSQKIARTYGNGGQEPPALAVITVPAGQTVLGERAQIVAAAARMRASVPGLRVLDFANTGDPRTITSDGRTTYLLVFSPLEKTFGVTKIPQRAEQVLARALPPGTQSDLTGLVQLSNSEESGGGPGVFLETVFGGLGALAVLAFVFASMLAFVPLLIAAVAILTTLLLILGLTYIADVSFIVQFLVSLVGLGVAIDYSLLLVTRWREERAHGRENHDAVVAAMTTAGRAVVLSGLTVAIGLIALVVLPVPGLRSVGYAGMLIPLVSTFVALTLLPAMLGGIGPRVDWPRIRHEDKASRGWTAWTKMVVRRRWLAAAVAIGILTLLIVPLFSLTTGETSASAQAHAGPAHAAYERLRAGGVSGGTITPVEVLVRSAEAEAVRARLASLPGMADALRSSDPDSNRLGTSIVVGIPRAETVNSTTLDPVRAARTALEGRPGVIGIAGVGAGELDYQHAVFGNFPLMFTIIALLTILLLARAFRSVVLAVKAVALNLISMAAAFGLMTWFWQEGHGSQALFGIPATGAITFWVPLLVFAFLFGLSMDYEVFILARVREEYDRTGSTDQAVITGLGRTGRLVTSAALILFLAFASLASAPNTDIKVLATGLGAGILLDATVVRALLLPSLVSLLGDLNWWFPDPVARVLRVRARGADAPGVGAEPVGGGPGGGGPGGGGEDLAGVRGAAGEPGKPGEGEGGEFAGAGAIPRKRE
jgi:RND superfamily putative drug exporter